MLSKTLASVVEKLNIAQGLEVSAALSQLELEISFIRKKVAAENVGRSVSELEAFASVLLDEAYRYTASKSEAKSLELSILHQLKLELFKVFYANKVYIFLRGFRVSSNNLYKIAATFDLDKESVPSSEIVTAEFNRIATDKECKEALLEGAGNKFLRIPIKSNNFLMGFVVLESPQGFTEENLQKANILAKKLVEVFFRIFVLFNRYNLRNQEYPFAA